MSEDPKKPIPREDIEEDSDKTPAQTPDARRASQRSLGTPEPCPSCFGRTLKDHEGNEAVCTVCEGTKYTYSSLTLETWKLRTILQDSKPPKPEL